MRRGYRHTRMQNIHNCLYLLKILSYSRNTLNNMTLIKLNNKNNKIKILITKFDAEAISQSIKIRPKIKNTIWID